MFPVHEPDRARRLLDQGQEASRDVGPRPGPLEKEIGVGSEPVLVAVLELVEGHPRIEANPPRDAVVGPSHAAGPATFAAGFAPRPKASGYA